LRVIALEEGLGGWAGDDAGFGLENAAGEIDFRAALAAFEPVDGLGDNQGISDDADGLESDELTELVGGGAAVDHDDVAVLEQFGSGFGDGAFFRGVFGEAMVKG